MAAAREDLPIVPQMKRKMRAFATPNVDLGMDPLGLCAGSHAAALGATMEHSAQKEAATGEAREDRHAPDARGAPGGVALDARAARQADASRTKKATVLSATPSVDRDTKTMAAAYALKSARAA